MTNFSISLPHAQSFVSPKVFRAIMLSAPLWASGVLFLGVMFSIANDASMGSLQFVALSLVIVVVATMAALRVMDYEVERANMLRSPEYRRMKLRSKRLRGA